MENVEDGNDDDNHELMDNSNCILHSSDIWSIFKSSLPKNLFRWQSMP